MLCVANVLHTSRSFDSCLTLVQQNYTTDCMDCIHCCTQPDGLAASLLQQHAQLRAKARTWLPQCKSQCTAWLSPSYDLSCACCCYICKELYSFLISFLDTRMVLVQGHSVATCRQAIHRLTCSLDENTSSSCSKTL